MIRAMNHRLISNWAKTANGVSIPLFRSTEQKPGGLMVIGGVHGDEPEGVELSTQTLTWLKSHALVNCSWHLIPCLNLDGFSRRQRTNGRGVDLNRNYPSKDWSPHRRAERYNPGPEPASEPEIRSLVKLIEQVKPGLIVHCHSWHPCIVYAGEPAKPWAQMIAAETGYSAKDDIGYPTPGSLSSYGWSDHKIPVICIEEQDHIPIQNVWPRFQKAIQRLFLEWPNCKPIQGDF